MHALGALKGLLDAQILQRPLDRRRPPPQQADDEGRPHDESDLHLQRDQCQPAAHALILSRMMKAPASTMMAASAMKMT